MKTYIFLLGIVLITMISCKKHLGKEDAKKQITTALNLPIDVEYTFTKAFTKDEHTEGNGVTVMLGGDEFEHEKNMIEMFERKKLISFEEIPHREESNTFLLGRTVRTWTTVKISLTDEGKKYLLKQDGQKFTVKRWETTVGDITTVEEVEPQKTARVDYVLSNTNITPFGECFIEKGKTISRSIYFSLTDDGWKIKNR